MTQPQHPLRVLEVALGVIDELGPVVRGIASRDRNLGDQLKRAAQSMALNLAEARGTRAGNRRNRLETALGSTQETRAALRIAAAWGYASRRTCSRIDRQLDQVAAMTWRWLHPKG